MPYLTRRSADPAYVHTLSDVYGIHRLRDAAPSCRRECPRRALGGDRYQVGISGILQFWEAVSVLGSRPTSSYEVGRLARESRLRSHGARCRPAQARSRCMVVMPALRHSGGKFLPTTSGSLLPVARGSLCRLCALWAVHPTDPAFCGLLASAESRRIASRG